MLLQSVSGCSSGSNSERQMLPEIKVPHSSGQQLFLNFLSLPISTHEVCLSDDQDSSWRAPYESSETWESIDVYLPHEDEVPHLLIPPQGFMLPPLEPLRALLSHLQLPQD